jgi:methyltransferase (TIGR00027 family)
MRDQASGTAIVVALGMLSLGHRRQDQGGVLVSSWERTLLHQTLQQIGGAPALLSTSFCRVFARPVERLFVPGILSHFGIRKRLIEQAVMRGIREGFTQVVVIGAGLDLLTLRIDRSAVGARCIELDHPATQARKRQMLAFAEVDPHRVELVPADLGRTSVSAALARSTRFDRSLPTVFVVEGLTMYLAATQVRSLLTDLPQAAPSARLLMTFMEPDAAGRARFTRQTVLLRILLRVCGEPFKWGLHAAAMPEFLDTAGWALRHLSGPPEFIACAGAAGISMTEQDFSGEYLAEASVQKRS